MKTKIMALVLAVMMVLGVATAWADGEDTTPTYTLTIQNNGNLVASSHDFAAYQIFTGTLSEDHTTLSNVDWGSGVNETTLLSALVTANAEGGSLEGKLTGISNSSTASDVAEIFGKLSSNSADAKALAVVIEGALNNTTAGTYASGVISGLATGYYFVKDTTSITGEGTNAISAFMLQLVGNTSVQIKADAPKIEKKIVEGTAQVDADSKSVGDTVNYILKSNVPDMSNFNAYTFKMQDDISDGLTLNKNITTGEDGKSTDSTFTVKVGNTTLTPGTDYEVTYGSTDADDFTINFKTLYSRFKSEADADFVANAAITVEYSATVNKDAVIGEEGNPNKVKLIYTNNANWDGNGTPGDNPDGPTGETPWDTVKTYVTEIDILKLDGNTKMPLKGVTFSISGDNLNQILTYSVSFNEKTESEFEASETKYYKLKDGTYTTKASTEATADYYDTEAAGKVFAKTESVTNTASATSSKINVVSGDDGIIKFTGLNAGEYTLHEEATLDGYNLLTGNIKVTISGKIGDKDLSEATISPDGNEKIIWSYNVEGAESDAVTTDANHVTITVGNFKGATLPSTGGVGTTMFYVGGGLLAIIAAVLLVTKRRVGSAD